jgi:hypothetical protein
MDYSLAVSAVECHAAFENDPDHPGQWQQFVNPGVGLKREALDVLHRQIGELILDNPFVDLGDVGMLETPGNHLLVPEQLAQATRHGGTVLSESDDLDRKRSIRIRTSAQIDGSRRPLAYFPDDPVLAYLFHAPAESQLTGVIVARKRSTSYGFRQPDKAGARKIVHDQGFITRIVNSFEVRATLAILGER